MRVQNHNLETYRNAKGGTISIVRKMQAKSPDGQVEDGYEVISSTNGRAFMGTDDYANMVRLWTKVQ